MAVEATIDKDWAEEVANNYNNIRRFNRYVTGEIAREVDLKALGGLVVTLDGEVDKAVELDEEADLVDLAFGEASLVISTGGLLQAAEEKYGSNNDVVTSLRKRTYVCNEHAGNELWILPVRGLELKS